MATNRMVTEDTVAELTMMHGVVSRLTSKMNGDRTKSLIDLLNAQESWDAKLPDRLQEITGRPTRLSFTVAVGRVVIEVICRKEFN